MISRKHAQLATILYADVFDYPLTEEESSYWLVFHSTGSRLKEVRRKNGFMALSGREKLVAKRQERSRLAQEKWAIAAAAGSILRFIPTIQLVGVTGGLAMENAKEEDDIDFFFIVSAGCLWISRLWAILAIELSGKRRRRGTTEVKDMICLNMFMTETNTAIPAAEHDLYVAHEVLQMKPLWSRGDTYGKFLLANRWVKRFLPNAWKEKYSFRHPRPDRGSMMMDSRLRGNDRSVIISFLRIVEPLARAIQLFYMQKHRTTEIVGDSVLRFHPKDARIWVKKALARRLERYKIPLDNVFYDS